MLLLPAFSIAYGHAAPSNDSNASYEPELLAAPVLPAPVVPPPVLPAPVLPEPDALFVEFEPAEGRGTP